MLPTCLPPVSRLCVLALQYCDNVPGSTHQRPSALNLAQLHQTNKGPVRQLGSWPWLHKRVGPAAAHVHDPIHRLAPSCHTEGVHAADNTRWGAADCAQCPPRPLPIICPQHFRDACAPPHCMVVGQSIVPVRFGGHAQPWSQARSIRRGGQQTQPHPDCNTPAADSHTLHHLESRCQPRAARTGVMVVPTTSTGHTGHVYVQAPAGCHALWCPQPTHSHRCV
jgi:hypothetical protein